MIFQVGAWYENRRGKYQALSIDGDRIQAKYVDGETCWLSIAMQSNIYQNIQHEREQITHRKGSSSLTKTAGFYKLLGFLAKKDARLLAFVPDKAVGSFQDKWQDSTGKALDESQKGIVIHPPETDKRWYECRVTFSATPQEIKLLEVFTQFSIVKANDTDGWNINNNKLWFALLEYGFRVGESQDPARIRATIPQSYLDAFDKG